MGMFLFTSLYSAYKKTNEQMGPYHVRRMVPSRHRLRQIPQQRRPRHPLGRHVLLHRLNPILSHGQQQQKPKMRLHQRERTPIVILAGLQEVPADVRGGADVGVRDGAGVVLLDVEDGVGSAVELSDRVEEWLYAGEGVYASVSVWGCGAGFWGFGGILLIFMLIFAGSRLACVYSQCYGCTIFNFFYCFLGTAPSA